MDPTNLTGNEDIICLCNNSHEEIVCDIDQDMYFVYSQKDIHMAVSKRFEHKKIEMSEPYRDLNLIYLQLQCNDLIFIYINNPAEKDKFMRLFKSLIFTKERFIICSNECLEIADTTYKNISTGHIYITQKLKKYLVNDIDSLIINFKRNLNIKCVIKNKKRKQLYAFTLDNHKRIKSTAQIN